MVMEVSVSGSTSGTNPSTASQNGAFSSPVIPCPMRIGARRALSHVASDAELCAYAIPYTSRHLGLR